MNDAKYIELIQKLIHRTINKQAIWNSTSRETEFILNLHSGSITIDSWVNDSFDNCIDFYIRNDKGIVIFSKLFNLSENPEEFHFLFNLHNVARESYFKIDDTVNGILKELDSDKTIGIQEKKDDDNLPW